MKKVLLIASIGFIIFSGCALRSSHPRITSVIVGGQTLAVTEAITPEQQARGLAGVKSLSDDRGMLFTFPNKQFRTFWMKGMLIPIDIIWIKDNQIVAINQNVPAPEPSLNVPDDRLTRYESPEKINYVLEVRAGFSQYYGLAEGQTVEYR